MRGEKSREALGVDFGYVLIDMWSKENQDIWHSSDYLHAAPVLHAVPSLRKLSQSRFGQRIYIVSKATPEAEPKTLAWLEYHRVFELLGIHRDHLYFCRERHEKAPICKHLGLTHFIDDRIEGLSHMDSVANRYLFRGRAEELSAFSDHVEKVTIVQSWPELTDKLLLVPA